MIKVPESRVIRADEQTPAAVIEPCAARISPGRNDCAKSQSVFRQSGELVRKRVRHLLKDGIPVSGGRLSE